MQTPLRALETLRTKYRQGVRAVDDSFQATKSLFEKHNVVFTVAGGLLSAGAAWAGYTARQIHQKKLEEKLQKIEEHMTNVYSLEEQQVKALTTAAARTGISYKTFFATSSTALIVGYALGFRGGRRFVIRRIPPDLLLAAKKQRSSNRLSRFLPGKSDPTKETPAPPFQPLAAAMSSGQSDVQSSTSGEASTTVSDNGAEAERPRGDEQRSNVSAGIASSSGWRESEPPANLQFGSRELKDPDRHRVATRDGVDAALGETGFERQFERVMRPEREAVGESADALDDILHATIPNLNGGSGNDGHEEGVAASRGVDGESGVEQAEASDLSDEEVDEAREHIEPRASQAEIVSPRELREEEEQGRNKPG